MSVTTISIPVEMVLKAIELKGIDVGDLRAKLTKAEKPYDKRRGYLDIPATAITGPRNIYYTTVEEQQL